MRAVRWLFLLLGLILVVGCQGQNPEVEEEEEDDTELVEGGGDTPAPTKVKVLKDPSAENKRARAALEKLKGRVGIDEKSDDRAVVLVDLAPIADKDLPAGLANLKGLTKLQEFYLAYKPVTDEQLAAIAGLKSLQKLSLYKTAITDAGLSHVASLTGLQELDLAFTKITDAGLANLKGLTELKKLNLAFTEVTDAGLDHLKELANLEVLSIGGTKVTDKGVATLQTALPKLTILGAPPAAQVEQ